MNSLWIKNHVTWGLDVSQILSLFCIKALVSLCWLHFTHEKHEEVPKPSDRPQIPTAKASMCSLWSDGISVMEFLAWMLWKIPRSTNILGLCVLWAREKSIKTLHMKSTRKSPNCPTDPKSQQQKHACALSFGYGISCLNTLKNTTVHKLPWLVRFS